MSQLALLGESPSEAPREKRSLKGQYRPQLYEPVLPGEEHLKHIFDRISDTCEIHLIIGPPGTGKTTSAISTYTKAAKANHNPLLLTFSRTAKEAAQSRLPADSNVMTLDALAYRKWVMDAEIELKSIAHPPIEDTQASSDAEKGIYQKVDSLECSPLILSSQLDSDPKSHPEKVGENLRNWVNDHPHFKSDANILQFFRPHDNPLNPGRYWQRVRLRTEHLVNMHTSHYPRSPTPEKIAISLWHLYLMLNKSFTFVDSLYYLAQQASFPKSMLSKIPETIIIDEVQDMTAPQIYTLCRLVENNPNVKNLYLIGDPHQSIMGFRGADPRHISQLIVPIAESQNNSSVLTRNYRSRESIVRWQERLRQKMPNKVGDYEITANQGGLSLKIKYDDPVEIVHLAKHVSTQNTVGIICTNRYVDVWERVLHGLYSEDLPYQRIESGNGGRTLLRGIAGLRLRNNPLGVQSSNSSYVWDFTSDLKQPTQIQPWLIQWIAEYNDIPDASSPTKIPLAKLVVAGVLFSKLFRKQWESKLPENTLKQMTASNENTELKYTELKYSEILRTKLEVTLDEAKKCVRPEFEHIPGRIAEGESIVELSALSLGSPSILIDEDLQQVGCTVRESFPKLLTMIEKHGEAFVLDPKIRIGTVHASKGQETDVILYDPTGPPSRDPKDWDVGMYPVHYVALSRAKHVSILCLPATSRGDIQNTLSTQSYADLMQISDDILEIAPHEARDKINGVVLSMRALKSLRENASFQPSIFLRLSPTEFSTPKGALPTQDA